MQNPDARPRVPHIEFTSSEPSPTRRRAVAAIAADLIRAAAGHDEFAELWMADALGTAMADADTTVLVLADLSDLVCALAAIVAQGDGRDRAEVIDRVATSWVQAAE